MEEEPESFKIEIRSKEKGLFVDVKPELIVTGSRCSDAKAGKDDHLTVVMNGDRIDQAHRKVDGREVWHHTGEYLQAQLDSVLANATEIVGISEFRKPNTYIISLTRIRLVFSLLSLSASIVAHFSWRLFATPKISRNENGLEARIVVDKRKIEHLVRCARGPASLFVSLLRKIPPKAFLPVIKFLGKRILVDPQHIRRLEDDSWFVFSNDRIGLATPGNGESVRFHSAAPLLDALLRVKNNIPVSLEDLGNFGPGTEFRVKTTFDPSASLSNSS